MYFICSVQYFTNVFGKKLAEAVPEVMGQICCNLSKILDRFEGGHTGNAFSSPFSD